MALDEIYNRCISLSLSDTLTENVEDIFRDSLNDQPRQIANTSNIFVIQKFFHLEMFQNYAIEIVEPGLLL